MKICTLNLRMDGYGVQVNILQILNMLSPEKQLPFKGKCFINVKSYAEKYGILMDKSS